MLKKSADLVAHERACEPLHVILHKHLDRGAIDGAPALNRHVHATADRHVGAQQQSRLVRAPLRRLLLHN